MKVTIPPAKIEGVIQAPPSKSFTQRGFAAALLHKGNTIISNMGISKDETAALSIIRSLGADVRIENESVRISSDFFHQSCENIIDCGESGLAMRMFTPIAALLPQSLTVTGTGSLSSRPMHFFEDNFPKLGVEIHSEYGMLPLRIKGPLRPKDLTVDGSVSSQFLTGLLYAFGETVQQETIITVTDLKSKPYIDVTLSVLKDFGYQIRHESYEKFFINSKQNISSETNYTVEGDWSNAAFMLVAGAIAGSVKVSGLNNNSAQADRKIIEVLQQCGAKISFTDDMISATKAKLYAFDVDATNCPDLFPPLAALAVHCKGTSEIRGIHRLRNKESDRALSLKNVFETMGASVTLKDDSMLIKGDMPLKHATVSSHGDHRIAMAAAVAGTAGAGVVIENAEAVEKSYPGFYDDLKSISISGIK